MRMRPAHLPLSPASPSPLLASLSRQRRHVGARERLFLIPSSHCSTLRFPSSPPPPPPSLCLSLGRPLRSLAPLPCAHVVSPFSSAPQRWCSRSISASHSLDRGLHRSAGRLLRFSSLASLLHAALPSLVPAALTSPPCDGRAGCDSLSSSAAFPSVASFSSTPPPAWLQRGLLAGRRWLSSSPSSSSALLVWLLIGVNVLVWCLWRWSLDERARYQFMMRHFTVSLRALREGRLHTLVTAAFSQQELSHLFVNCFSLYAFGLPLGSILGWRRMLLVYLGGAVASSLSHILYQNALLPRLTRPARPPPALTPRTPPRSYDTPALGASGSAMACTVLFACLFPSAQFLLYYVVPVPAWLCASGLVAYDAVRALQAQPTDRTAHFGHLGVHHTEDTEHHSTPHHTTARRSPRHARATASHASLAPLPGACNVARARRLG